MEFQGINLLAVALATIGFMAVGFLWYGPLFGKQWMKLHGWTKEDFAGANMTMTMVQGVINALITSIGLALVFHWLGVETIGRALHVSFILWIAFSATTQALAFIYERQKLGLTLINFGNQLVGFLLAATILALF